MAVLAKFVVYNSQSGYDSLAIKAQDTFYFVRETRRIYRADELFNDIINVSVLPTESIIPYKIYLVNNEFAYLRTSNSWILLNDGTSNNNNNNNSIEVEGITLNGKTIGGIKFVIQENDVLNIPEFWQYNVKNSLTLLGTIINNGEINIE